MKLESLQKKKARNLYEEYNFDQETKYFTDFM